MLLSVLQTGHSSNFFILLHFSHTTRCPQLQNKIFGGLVRHNYNTFILFKSFFSINIYIIFIITSS